MSEQQGWGSFTTLASQSLPVSRVSRLVHLQSLPTVLSCCHVAMATWEGQAFTTPGRKRRKRRRSSVWGTVSGVTVVNETWGWWHQTFVVSLGSSILYPQSPSKADVCPLPHYLQREHFALQEPPSLQQVGLVYHPCLQRQNTSDISKISTMYNCNLEVFQLKSLKCISKKSGCISTHKS